MSEQTHTKRPPSDRTEPEEESQADFLGVSDGFRSRVDQGSTVGSCRPYGARNSFWVFLPRIPLRSIRGYFLVAPTALTLSCFRCFHFWKLETGNLKLRLSGLSADC